MFNPSQVLLSAIATGAGDAYQPISRHRTFQGTVAGTGAVSATILVQVSNDGVVGSDAVSSTATWLTIGTITLSGTTSASDGFASESAWRFVRGNITAISGTGATGTLTMGVQK